jgi:hypothetical protein
MTEPKFENAAATLPLTRKERRFFIPFMKQENAITPMGMAGGIALVGFYFIRGKPSSLRL